MQITHDIQDTSPDTGTSALIRSIHKLPFSVFIDATCDEGLSGLIIGDTPSAEDLQAAWDDITLEYQDAVGGQEKELVLELYKQALETDVFLLQVDGLIEVMKDRYVARFAGYLRKWSPPTFALIFLTPRNMKRT